MRQRIALLVYVDLDPVNGPFHTEDSARNNVAGILDNAVGHYNPIVAHAPDSMQPPNHPSRRTVNDSQEIPRLAEPLDRPYAGVAPTDTGTLTTADLAMDYTEGNR